MEATTSNTTATEILEAALDIANGHRPFTSHTLTEQILEVEWAQSRDAADLVAIHDDAGHEIAWIDEAGRITVADDEGNIIGTGITVTPEAVR